MLDQKGFDLWAEGYDRSVELSDEEARFPFAGYKALLNEIYNRVLAGPHRTVLDIGFGTAFLTSRRRWSAWPGKRCRKHSFIRAILPGGCGPS